MVAATGASGLGGRAVTHLGLPGVRAGVREETAPDFPRDWIEFVDPDRSDALVRADLTWLLSSWTCVYGRGCEGVVEGRADDGCCTHGAFYADDEDEVRIEGYARQLKKKTWEYAAVGRRLGVSEVDELDGEPARRTRTVDGACVFLNRPGFPGGAGCALHALAERIDLHPLETKPDVCWQLPVRRTQDWVTRPDDVEVLVTTIGEFDRRGWGSGGADLHWWCTSSPVAHVGAEPLYLSYAAELTALLGEPAYAELARLCARRAGSTPPHPADAGQVSNLYPSPRTVTR